MDKFTVSTEEYSAAVKAGKREHRAMNEKMVNDYLENRGGVITRGEQGGLKTYWEHDPETQDLKEIK